MLTSYPREGSWYLIFSTGLEFLKLTIKTILEFRHSKKKAKTFYQG